MTAKKRDQRCLGYPVKDEYQKESRIDIFLWKFPILSHSKQQAHHSFLKARSFRISFLVIAVFLLIILTACQIIQQPSTPKNVNDKQQSSNTVALIFAGSPITAAQLDAIEFSKVQSLAQQGLYLGTSAQERQIEDFAFYALFDKIEFAKQIKQHGNLSSDDFIAQIVPLQSITPQTAHEFYNTHPALFSRSAPRIHVREIMVRDKNLASQLLDQLKSGESFAQLAQQYSVDPQQYKDQGGDLGWVTEGQMPIAWDDVAFSLSTGETSNIFQVANLYCILQVISGPSYSLIPYKDVSPPVPIIAAKYLQQQKFLEWLSEQILQEPIKILKPTYSQAVQNALTDLQLHPDQGLLGNM